MTAVAPQAEVLRPSAPRESFEAVRVPASAPLVEVRCRSTHCNESDVDVHAVAGPHHVAEQPPEVVNAIGRGLSEQPHERTLG